MASQRITVGTVVKLAVASLIVGLLLAALGWTPADLLSRVSSFAHGAWNFARDALGWAGSYMLLGAIVVLPLWLARYLWRRLNGRGS